MDQGQLRNYLVYAIGEIALVAIGILIALQVNNWNEKRKVTAKIEMILELLDADLIENIKRTNTNFDYYINYDSLTKVVLFNQVDKEDYRKNIHLNWLTTYSSEFIPVTENMEKLLKLEESLPDKYTEILSSIKFIQQEAVLGQRNFNDLREVRKRNFDHAFLNVPAGGNLHPEAHEEYVDYLLSDEYHKKMVFNYWAYSNHYVVQVSRYQSESLSLLGKMKILRNGYEARDIIQLYRSLNIKPCEPIDCENDGSKNKARKNHRAPTLIYNSRKSPISLLIKNRIGTLLAEYILEPGQFKTIGPGFRTIDQDFLRIIEYNDDNGCIQKYIQRPNGFLIIE